MCQQNNQKGESCWTLPPSEEIIRELYHSVNDAIFLHDAETGAILDVNETMCEMYGYTREEARELSIGDLSSGVPPYTQDTATEYVRKTVDGEPQVFDWQAVDSDGDRFWVEVSMQRADVDDEQVVLVVAREITERKCYETQLEETTEELEALNRVVRHDIRNDMSIMLGWAELLEDHVDEEGQAYLEKILASGEHVVELTATARDYIETLTNENELAVRPIPLASFLENELDLRRETYPHADFVQEGEIPDVEVAANEMLGAVFRNLLNNAVQHNDKDEPVVTVTTELADEAVVVRIADNGPGIPDDRKESIFEKGEKGIESSGSGLGLYLVQTLVSQYNGSVRVEDNDPVGTVFVVRLPRAN